MSKQKIIVFALIVIIIVIIVAARIILCLQKGEEGEEAIPISELSGLLLVEPIDWQDPDKPMQSLPLDENEIPKEAIKIEITSQGFSPSSFEVNNGEKVVLSVTSGDRWAHVFKFKDSSLAEVAVGVTSGETRAITFYAPSEAGEYPFFCDVPGHERRGEKGVMIVK